MGISGISPGIKLKLAALSQEIRPLKNGMITEAARVLQISAATEHFPVPAMKHRIRERLCCCLQQVDHHFRDPVLGGAGRCPGSLQTEGALNGGLDTRPVQRFPLDLRGIDRFQAHDRYAELEPVFIGNMTGCVDQEAGLLEKTRFAVGELLPVPDEVGPVAKLPVPGHNREGPDIWIILCSKSD